MIKRVFLLFLLFLIISCDKKFDSTIWKNHNDIDEIDNPRWEMRNNIGKALEMKKRNESEIISLLGKPYNIDSTDTEKTFYYPIGWKTGFGIDPDFFIVNLTLDGQYISNGHEQH